MLLLWRGATGHARDLALGLQAPRGGKRQRAPPVLLQFLRQGVSGERLMLAVPEVGEGHVEDRLLVTLGDQADLEEVVEFLPVADVDQRQALHQLHDAPGANVETKLPEKVREINDAHEQEVAARRLHLAELPHTGPGQTRCLTVLYSSIVAQFAHGSVLTGRRR